MQPFREGCVFLFKINAINLHWINNTEDYPDDLCLHGHAIVKIGTEAFEYDATVSATALFLLKTLTENHIINTDNQMLPCCGHFLIANEKLDNVNISGCPNGIDWSVMHDDGKLKIITETGMETIIDIHEYKNEVYAFADKIEAFYKKCLPKNIPTDDFEKNGYTAFWNEWLRRRK